MEQTVTPRLSETPLFRTQTSINRNGGDPSLFKDPAIPKRLFGKPLHSETPPLRTNPYLNPLQKCASAAGSGDFSTTDSGV